MRTRPRYLFFFRPGVESRNLARVKVGIRPDACWAQITYPIPNSPWRPELAVSIQPHVVRCETLDLLFAEAERIRRDHPSECLLDEQICIDYSEVGNEIHRDRASGILCFKLSLWGHDGRKESQFWLREDSDVACASPLLQTITAWVAPWEKLSDADISTWLSNLDRAGKLQR